MLKRETECRLRRRWEDAPKNRRGMCCQGNISRMKTFQAPLPHDRSKMIIKIIFCTTDLYQVGNRGLQGHLWPAAATLTANFDEKKLQTGCGSTVQQRGIIERTFNGDPKTYQGN